MTLETLEDDEHAHHGTHDVLHEVMDMTSSAMEALSRSALVGDADGTVKRHGTVVGSTATLANCAIGAGVLAIPFAIRELGYALGGIVVLVAAMLVAYTLLVLVRAGSAFGSTSYQGLVKDAFGLNVSRAVSVVLIVYLFGSCVAYLIIIGDSYTKVVSAFAGDAASAWWANRRFAIAIIGAFVVTPLSLLREMSRLALASAMAVMALGYTATVIMCKGLTPAADSTALATAFKLDIGSISAVPIVVFAFQCHIQVLAIFSELGSSETAQSGEIIELHDSSASERRRMKRMRVVIALAVGVCFVGYISVGEFAYISHPDVTSNVLDSYDKNDKAMLLATILMGCSAVSSFPVNHHAARAALDDLLASAFGWEECAPGQSPATRHVSQTLGFVLIAAVVSFAVTDLGKVFELVGATCGSLVMFVIPALLLVHPKMQAENRDTLDPLEDLAGLDDVTRELLSSARDLLERDFGEDAGDIEEDVVGISRSNSPGVGAIVTATTLCMIALFVATSNVYVIFFR